VLVQKGGDFDEIDLDTEAIALLGINVAFARTLSFRVDRFVNLFSFSINQPKKTQSKQHEAVGPDVRVPEEAIASPAGVRRSIHGGLVTRGHVQHLAHRRH